MRIICLTLLGCFLSTFALAATPISKDQANAYYEACKKSPDPRFSAEVQDLFCACTASHYMTALTVEDVKTMGQQNQSGRNAMNKMILDVYAPCIQYPTRAYHYDACITDPKAKILGDPTKLCSCAADSVASHLEKNARIMFQDILRKNPNIGDPMQTLYDDAGFQSYAKSQLMSCVTR